MKIKIKFVNEDWLDEDGVVYTFLFVNSKPLLDGGYDIKHNHYQLYKIVEESYNDPVDGMYKIIKPLGRHTCKKLSPLVALTLQVYRQDDTIALLEERIQSLQYQLDQLQTKLAQRKRGKKNEQN